MNNSTHLQNVMDDKIKYVYPQLSNKDFGWFRFSGPGLANCMFIAARAYILSKKYKCGFIEPTWMKFSLGPFIRREKDKRIYSSLFKSLGIVGLQKAILLFRCNCLNDKSILKVSGLDKFFVELEENYDLVKGYIETIMKDEVVSSVELSQKELSNSVSVHVRLGDYVPRLRIDVNWYKGLIENILKICPSQKFIIFSDGTDEELSPILNLPNTERKFYGNAFADMYAISKSKLVIASNSTFSAWGAFIGRVPIIFNKRHFPQMFKSGSVLESVIGDSIQLPVEYESLFQEKR